jgi:hypothetical protein
MLVAKQITVIGNLLDRHRRDTVQQLAPRTVSRG